MEAVIFLEHIYTALYKDVIKQDSCLKELKIVHDFQSLAVARSIGVSSKLALSSGAQTNERWVGSYIVVQRNLQISNGMPYILLYNNHDMLAAELLAIIMRKSANIKGLTIADRTPKISQYADDATFFWGTLTLSPTWSPHWNISHDYRTWRWTIENPIWCYWATEKARQHPYRAYRFRIMWRFWE